MKSVVLSLSYLAIFVSTALAQTASPDVEQQNTDLKQLLADVRKVLPKGWRAEITPDVPRDLILVTAYRYNTGHLLIWHEEKVLARWPRINGPARLRDDDSIELEYNMENPKFDLVIVPYMSRDAYEKAVKENARREGERLTFEEKFHRSMKWAAMASRPLEPSSYEPETNADKELIRQYTLLWAATQLEQLPSYYYKTLSFTAPYLLSPLSDLRIRDEKLEKEKEDLRGAILKIVTAYPEVVLPDRP